MSVKRELTKATFASELPTKRKKPLDHLTRDVLAAQAAGMSYGKYKALHPHTKGLYDDQEPIQVDASKKVLICICCGKTFLAPKHAGNKAYCSDECKKMAYIERDKERHPDRYIPKPCPICGKLVQPDHGRVYCSVSCKVEAERRKARESQRRKREAKQNGSV